MTVDSIAVHVTRILTAMHTVQYQVLVPYSDCKTCTPEYYVYDMTLRCVLSGSGTPGLTVRHGSCHLDELLDVGSMIDDRYQVPR